MLSGNHRKVLGLDIGANSIGFALLKLDEQKGETLFEELASNSIVFSSPNGAEDRRKARGNRRIHERKSLRNRNSRKIFVRYGLAQQAFIDNTTQYLNDFKMKDRDVYSIRQRAIEGEMLTQEEFVLATYSILTDRGYSNMFAPIKKDTKEKEEENEEGVINEAVNHNAMLYKQAEYPLPSMVLTQKRQTLQNAFQNVAVRNKKEDYSNSLGREMHKEEFKAVVVSQSKNKNLFCNEEECLAFVDEILDEETPNRAFFQRPLKSFDNMVEYCAFYDAFNPKGSHKRMPLANIANIELTLRQSIDNYEAIHSKTGEIRIFSDEEKQKIVDFWIETPDADEIKSNNIYKNAGFKDIVIHLAETKEFRVLNIKAHRALLEVLRAYSVDFRNKDNAFYNELLLVLYYYKNSSSRIKYIEELIAKYVMAIDGAFVKECANLKNMDGFGSFSLKFANEVLELMQKGVIHSKALEELGYKSKYLNMPTYSYLPPLEPTPKDREWLQSNLPYFQTQHLFYQPKISPKVKRVIGVLRKLVNELIAKYGAIDEIRIETARELNSQTEEKAIEENQKKNDTQNREAQKFLKDKNLAQSPKNLERVKLWKEQGGFCLYSGEEIVEEEMLDENQTEVEHFIPRSVIWINSFKNKILVKKKYNQNKGSQNPITYLKSKGEWENFKGRIKLDPKSPKYKWLTHEEHIENVMQKEHWQESYLNDTRTATKTIAKYLNHYLYPNQNLYGKGEKRYIASVTGKAIGELKHIWGIHKVMPKDENDKKDRDTQYHHTLDAFAIALCSNGAMKTLNDSFKQNENHFQTKAQKAKLKEGVPTTTDGVSIVEYLKSIVEKYETHQRLVCPYNKRKTNMKGFKDGNLKLYITQDPKDKNKEILAEMEKVAIDSSLLIKKVNGFDKPRSDDEVKKVIQSIQSRLNPQKQANIIEAIEIYANRLLELRKGIDALDLEIKTEQKRLKTGKQHKEDNDSIKKQTIAPLQAQKKELSLEMQNLKCSFATQKGKRQIVRKLNLYREKIEKSSADSIIFTQRKERTIERLSVDNFREALENKEPFVIKENKNNRLIG